MLLRAPSAVVAAAISAACAAARRRRTSATVSALCHCARADRRTTAAVRSVRTLLGQVDVSRPPASVPAAVDEPSRRRRARASPMLALVVSRAQLAPRSICAERRGGSPAKASTPACADSTCGARTSCSTLACDGRTRASAGRVVRLGWGWTKQRRADMACRLDRPAGGPSLLSARTDALWQPRSCPSLAASER